MARCWSPARSCASTGPGSAPTTCASSTASLRYSKAPTTTASRSPRMAYTGHWYATDQIPQRAVHDGSLDRFGAIDPTDGGVAQRYACPGAGTQTDADRRQRVNAYFIKSDLHLFNNFTYFLDNPVDGRPVPADRQAHASLAAAPARHFSIRSRRLQRRDHARRPNPLRRHQCRPVQHQAARLPVYRARRPGARGERRPVRREYAALDRLAADHRRAARRSLLGRRSTATSPPTPATTSTRS